MVVFLVPSGIMAKERGAKLYATDERWNVFFFICKKNPYQHHNVSND